MDTALLARVRSQIALAKAQKQTVDLEKMAALGQLTAGINHEIKNPIGAPCPFFVSQLGNRVCNSAALL